MMVAPARLSNPLGGLSTHKSSQISVPIITSLPPSNNSLSEKGTLSPSRKRKSEVRQVEDTNHLFS